MDQKELYLKSINEFKEITSGLDQEVQLIVNDDNIVHCESHLDGWDYCYGILIGLVGVYITNSAKIDEYLADIHKAASDAKGEYDFFQKLLGSLLHHKGDHIDIVEAPFKNRAGGVADVSFHRLLWGHDIISVGKDNPFYLMVEQMGLKGIIQTIRHLIADTLSKQGLPMPGSSFFDYVGENGKTSNYLIKVSKFLSDSVFDNKSRAQDIYSHLFTIKGQDLAYNGIVDGLTKLYCHVRGIKDKLRMSEIRFMSFSISFWGKALYGVIQYQGIPFISIPLAQATLVEFLRIKFFEAQNTKRMNNETKRLEEDIKALEEHELFIDQMIGDDYFDLKNSTVRKQNIALIESMME